MNHSYSNEQITPHDSKYLIPNKTICCINKVKTLKQLGNEFLAACGKK
jgi:hypothetical protein